MDKGGSDRNAKGRSKEAENCLALKKGNDDDIVMDCEPAAHGNQDAPVAPALLASKEKVKLVNTILGTDPCYGEIVKGGRVFSFCFVFSLKAVFVFFLVFGLR